MARYARCLLPELCKQSFGSQQFPARIQKITRDIMQAHASGQQIPASTAWRKEGLSQDEGYQVAAAGCARSMREKDARPIGRKIGFTNTNIWPEYNIDTSNWGYIYMRTLPKIEPEIVFRMKSAPSSSMDDTELLDCIFSYAPGLEIVQSVYPDWRFNSAETTAQGALHRFLWIGNWLRPASEASKDEIVAGLSHVKVDLTRNNELMDRGSSKNVLGSPLNALRHLCEILEKQTLHPPVQPREIITTGTMTKALSISQGQRWRSCIGGSNFQRLTYGNRQFLSMQLDVEQKKLDNNIRKVAKGEYRKVATMK
ncbi:hypothetical protein LTR70_009904 [Exophiala xenobiotica]|uniref:Fumarylacetoacetase-like C-terminal domain-containing protein n=1 Tax=Lithohypha guttulata TaxID=1690604 RepID=A0ABR0JXY3_9EURO|nr:hypothetical protein LTR24_009742 [Lithohypha guttulata]KAK5309906.1 hypothetical protein LTR70_009904 [Exophiala xenobiotica]